MWTTNNDPTVREQSIHTDDIPWEEHVEWYRKRLARADSRMFIGVEQEEPVGVARFDVSEGEAVISIAVERPHRGRGVGQQLIALVSAQALAWPGVRAAVAYIRPSNVASRRAFLNNQYREVAQTEIAGTRMLKLEKATG